jgi:hypothetical protein
MHALKRRLAFCLFASGLLFFGGCSTLKSDSSASSVHSPGPRSTAEKDAGGADAEILEELLADDIADAEELEYYDKAVVLRVLTETQPHVTGKRAVGVAYLLASLNHRYDENRARVMDAFHQCLAQPPGEACDEDIVSYVVSLCYRGDDALMKPLMKLGPVASSQGAVAETLSAFYAETIADDPESFLKSLSEFPLDAQKKIAALMASDLVLDPDEAISDDVFDEVYERLSAVRRQKKSSLATSARIVLEAIDRANKEAHAEAAAEVAHR